MIYSDDRFQIFLSFFYYDFSNENSHFLNFSLSNDGSNDDWKFLNFSKFWKFVKLLTRPNFENFDQIFRELHRPRNMDLSVSELRLMKIAHFNRKLSILVKNCPFLVKKVYSCQNS